MTIRRIATSRCARTSSSVCKLRQTYFIASSRVMRYGILNTNRKSSARAVSVNLQCQRGRRNQPSDREKSIHANHVLSWEEHCLQCGLDTGTDDQSASLQGVPAAYGSQRVWRETRVITEQNMAASLRQCSSSQHSENPAVLGLEDHHRTGTVFRWFVCLMAYQLFLGYLMPKLFS